MGVIPSPLVHEGIVYTVKNGGIFSAFGAQTGKELKTAGCTAPSAGTPHP
jgi:hypothetical protein